MPNPQDLIGEVHNYRSPGYKEITSSTVVSVKEVTNFLGQKKTVAVLQSGTEVPAEDVYVENFAADTGEAKLSPFNSMSKATPHNDILMNVILGKNKKFKFSIISDETDLIKVGVFDFKHHIEFQKSDLKLLIEGLKNFHQTSS